MYASRAASYCADSVFWDRPNRRYLHLDPARTHDLIGTRYPKTSKVVGGCSICIENTG